MNTTTPGVCVVTGAASGIGEAVARRFAAAGHSVALADIDAVNLERVRASLDAQGVPVLAGVVDVAHFPAVEAFAARVHAELGDVTHLVNNAGIETTGALWEVPPARWDLARAVTIDGVFYGVRAFVPRMVKAGIPAMVINIASVGGVGTSPFMAPYIAAKHAVLAITECLHEEFAEAAPHLRASAVLPGTVATNIFRESSSASRSGDALRDRMAAALSGAMSAEEAAEIIYRGALSGQRWIFTDPERAEVIARNRFEKIEFRATPALEAVSG